MSRRRQQKPRRQGWQYLVAIAGTMLVLVAAAVYITRDQVLNPSKAPGTASAAEHPGLLPPFHDSVPATPLPPTLSPSRFENPMVEQAYRVAEQIPELLFQEPCYCGCERLGHRSLHDCFRSYHAANCAICINEALLAGRMHNAGKTPAEIRAEIVREFGHA